MLLAVVSLRLSDHKPLTGTDPRTTTIGCFTRLAVALGLMPVSALVLNNSSFWNDFFTSSDIELLL